MTWWWSRLPVALLAGLALALVLISPGEGAPPKRPKVRWEHNLATTCTDPRRGSSDERSPQYHICVDLEPGSTAVETVTLIPDGEVDRPRLVRQTANGARVIAATPEQPLPTRLEAGERVEVTIDLIAQPGLRARNISGRIYLADKQAVLSPPLNIRIRVMHPTPEELARTPVVVPTNHVQLVPRPPLSLQQWYSGRFNIRHLVVKSGTTVTWTNNAAIEDEGRETARAVKGTLCDATSPISPLSPCELDPAAVSRCALTVDEEEGQVITDEEDGRILCFISPRLGLEGHYSLLMTRPLPRQPLTYYMEEPLHDADAMIEVIEQGGQELSYHPYLTVK